MPSSAAMRAHTAQNVTFLCPVWKITAADGLIAAYAMHTRRFTFNSQLYLPSFHEPSRDTQKLNLETDSGEITGAFDDIITESDVDAGRWRDARIYKAYVCYIDLTMGAEDERNGFVGKIHKRNGTYKMEFLSLSQKLQQEIGDATSPVDRNRTLADTGVTVASFTHTGTVTAVTDRRRFTVSVVQANNYFRYGKITFTGGANSGRAMEIKSNVAGVLELQLPMPSTVAIGDAVSLIRGYSGTRDDAKALGSPAILNAQFEPDQPLLYEPITYPQ